MSQLIDRLNRVAKAAPRPMGFRAAQPPPARPQMLLIASLAETDNSLPDHVAGADAVLLNVSRADAKAIQRLVRTLPDIPWGAWLKDGAKEAAVIVEAGADFVVFPAAAAASAAPQGNKVGKVLQVEPSLGEGLLRAINDLPVDAALIAGESKEGDLLTWQHLMFLQRAASLLTKPLLVAVPASITTTELGTLWEIGIDGVVVAAGQAGLKELREAIGRVAASTRRKRGKVEARVTSIRMETPAETEEEDE